MLIIGECYMTSADIIQAILAFISLGLIGILTTWIYRLYKEREKTMKQALDSEKQILEQRMQLKDTQLLLKDQQIEGEKRTTEGYKVVADEYIAYLERQLLDWQTKANLPLDIVGHVDYTELVTKKLDLPMPSKTPKDEILLDEDLKREIKELLSAFERIEIELPVPDIKTLLIRGNAYYKADEFDKALRAYSRIIEIEPDNVIGLHNRVLLYGDMGDYQSALKDLSKLESLKPDMEVYCIRSNVYNVLGDYQLALQDADTVIEKDAQHVAAYWNKGLAYYGLKQFENAIQAFTKCIEFEPIEQFYFLRGICFGELERHEEAICDFEAVIAINADSAEGYLNRGVSHYHLNDVQKALEDYDIAIKLKSDLIDAYIKKAHLLDNMNKYAEALVVCNSAIKLDSDDNEEMAKLYSVRADIQCNLEENKLALDDYQ